MKNKKTRLNEAGFSLIELMIVIGIMGLLIGVVGPKLMNNFKSAKVDTTRVQMKQMVNVLKTYYLDCGQYPTTDQGLEALKTKPTAGPECKNFAPGGYLDKLPKDGWDRDFMYTSDGNTFEIKSFGDDKAEGGADYGTDIIVSNTD